MMIKQIAVALLWTSVGAGVYASEAPQSVELTAGEIKKIDVEQQKITIKHAEIKSLGMMAMTMVFKVKEAAMLDKVKVGDQVNFAVERLSGGFTLTYLEQK